MVELYDISNWCKNGCEIDDYPYIGTIDKEVNLFEVINVCGEIFIPGVLSADRKKIGVRRSEMNLTPEEKAYEPYVICPYCGHVDRDSFEHGDGDTIQCGSCGAELEFERNITAEYTTRGLKPPEIKIASWVK